MNRARSFPSRTAVSAFTRDVRRRTYANTGARCCENGRVNTQAYAYAEGFDDIVVPA
jgi:hypothetical protein